MFMLSLDADLRRSGGEVPEEDLVEWSWKNPNRLFIALAVSDMKDIFNSQQQISEPRLIFLN